MLPLGLSINGLARDTHVPPNRINGIVHGQRSITADTAFRLAAYFGTTPEVWLNLQTEYDLRRAQRELGPEIERTVRKRVAA